METKRDRILSRLLSLLIHILIVVFLLYPNIKNKEQEEKTSGQESMSATLSEQDTAGLDSDKVIHADIVEASNESEDTCTLETSNYIGIGIVHSLASGLIMQAPPQYPAAQAGIRVGDIFINATEDGEYKIIEVSRNNVPLKFRIKTQPICYS